MRDVSRPLLRASAASGNPVISSPLAIEVRCMTTPVCVVKAPGQCTSGELDAFVSLVRAGGQVTPRGLLSRVQRAHSLAFLRTDDHLIGVAGLKFPSANHRAEVARGTGWPLSESGFPLELGWVFVLPSARGGRSYVLCEPLLASAANDGVFATSTTSNIGMHVTLHKLGFVRKGAAWPSSQNSDVLWLFVRPAETAVQ